MSCCALSRCYSNTHKPRAWHRPSNVWSLPHHFIFIGSEISTSQMVSQPRLYPWPPKQVTRFFVLRRRRGIDLESAICKLACSSLNALAIAPSVAIHNSFRESRSSAVTAGSDTIYIDNSVGRQIQDIATTVLTVLQPISKGVPVVGAPIEASIGGLLEILKALDVSTQH